MTPTSIPLTEPARAILERAIEHLLVVGYTDQSLRTIATELGTSHRMLSYHFGHADGFWLAVIDHLRETEAHRQAGFLAASTTRLPPIEEVWTYFTSPSHLPVFQLMFEIYIKALRDRERFSAFLEQVIHGWLERLAPAMARQHGLSPSAARARARVELALMRGLMLDLITTGDRAGTTQAIRWYARHTSSHEPQETP